MSTEKAEKVKWNKTTDVQWVSSEERGYTGTIDLAANVYTLTIAGPGAPGPEAWDTLRLAKNSFRKYLFTK